MDVSCKQKSLDKLNLRSGIINDAEKERSKSGVFGKEEGEECRRHGVY